MGGTESGTRPAPARDPNLTAVVDAWADLPPVVRAGIVATVRASGWGGGKARVTGIRSAGR